MILRGGPESNVTVNGTKFFESNVSESISSIGITESSGLLLYNVCEYEDKKGTATFENYEKATCRNSGENLRWRLHQGESNFGREKVVLNFVSVHWDPPNNWSHHSVKFQFTISTTSADNALPLPLARGFAATIQVIGPLEKSYARLGIGMLFFTNETIHPSQRFLQTNLFDFGVEEEPGNFLSTVVLLNKREPPQAGDEVDMLPAYVFWRDVCFVDPVDRWSAGRHVVAFQSSPTRDSKTNRHINRSLPQALFGFKRFNIHVHSNDTAATMSEWFGFGSAGDGFFVKTNYTDWSFIMALGSPPPASTSVVARLFTPLVLPLLALLGSVAYIYASQHWGPPLNDGIEVTRPLINEVSSGEADDDGGYPGFGDLKRTRLQENSNNIEGDEATAIPTSSYGAI
ncbi:hypothetical protein [Echinococcus multilocularis]|uniref:Uncharacterized protein n=1 Tax=Echinococcus multilocularis TaxID=6211 RepID=A0A068Y1Z0_ECHMU|nr:hypothetical protein [Echinococcus multilocularis]